MGRGIKDWLYGWLGKNKLGVPSYDIKQVVNEGSPRAQFRCELRVPGQQYVGVGVSGNKRDAATKAARDFAQFLIQHNLLFPDEIPATSLEPVDVRTDVQGGWTAHNSETRLNEFRENNRQLAIQYKTVDAGSDHTSGAGGDTLGRAVHTILLERKVECISAQMVANPHAYGFSAETAVLNVGVEVSLGTEDLDLTDQKGFQDNNKDQLRKRSKGLQNGNSFPDAVAGSSTTQSATKKQHSHLKSVEPETLRCRECDQEVGSAYVERRHHIMTAHLKTEEQTDEEISNTKMSACFPSCKVFSNEQCAECGKVIRSVSGRRSHISSHHLTKSIECVIPGCGLHETTPSRLKRHIQSTHRVSLSSRSDSDVFHSFAGAKKEYDAAVATQMPHYFPFKLRRRSAFDMLAHFPYVHEISPKRHKQQEKKEETRELLEQKEATQESQEQKEEKHEPLEQKEATQELQGQKEEKQEPMEQKEATQKSEGQKETT